MRFSVRAFLTRWAVFAAIALSFLPCRSCALEPVPVPTRFVASIGGFLGRSYRVEFKEEKLFYTSSGRDARGTIHRIITPTPAQWAKFWQELEAVHVWRWKDDYTNRNVMDGTQWSLEIAAGPQAVKTRGSNSYPNDDASPNGKPEPTKSFTRYLAAVRALLGDLAFE